MCVLSGWLYGKIGLVRFSSRTSWPHCSPPKKWLFCPVQSWKELYHLIWNPEKNLVPPFAVSSGRVLDTVKM